MTVAVERLQWRLGVYDRIFSACAVSGVSPLKFLTFRPERLRIRIGESLLRSHVPIIFAPDLADRLSAILPPAAPAAPGGFSPPDRDTLRRWLSLAQLDGDVDALDVASWKGADDFLRAFASLYARFFDEAKASGSGEETAALFQLVAASSLRNVLLHRVGGNERFLGLAALLAHLCDRALAAVVEREGDGLSARLGLLLIAACSPLAVMGSADPVVARLGNAYRTTPSALERARAVIRAQIERPAAFDLHTFRARLAGEMLADPGRRRELTKTMLAEGVRDLSLLSTLTQGTELRELSGKTSALTEALFTPLGPEKLLQRLSRHPGAGQEPLQRIQVLVSSVSGVLAGDREPLARLGSMEERADLAAAGALVLALDELALEQGGKALAMVRPVPDAESAKAREDGRAYFFSLDDTPLFLLPRKRNEAFLFADMKDFTKRTAEIHEEAMGDFLKRMFYEPILRTCGQLARNPQARVSVVNLLGDAVAARGDVASMIALALYVRKLLEDAAAELAAARTALDVDEQLAEIQLEIARVERQLASLPPGSAERPALETHLRELLEGREQRRAKHVGSGLEAGVFVSFGSEATVIEVGGEDVGQWRVVIAEHLNAAARGTNRSAALQAERNEQRARDEAATGRALVDPFRVHTSPDPNDVSTTTAFHNAGAALTGEALQAFRDASAQLRFTPMTLTRATLPARLSRYWLTREREELVVCEDASGRPVLLFRKTGRSIFRGLEAGGGHDIHEIVLVDGGFGRDLVDALAQRR